MQYRQVPIWHKAPFIRFVLPLVGGFLLADMFPVKETWLWLVFVSLLSSLLLLQFSIIRLHYTVRWITGLAVTIMLASLAGILLNKYQIRKESNWFGHHLSHTVAVIGEPQSIPSPGNKSARLQLNISGWIDYHYAIHPATGKLNIYIPLESQQEFLPGDTWVFNISKIKCIKSAGNPGSFDYAKFCARKNIFHQVHLKKADFFLLQKSGTLIVKKLLAKSQLHAIKTIRKNNPQKLTGANYGIADWLSR